MKRIFSLVLAGLAGLAFSGCSGGGDSGVSMDTHYLTDINGVGIEGVEYECVSISGVQFTDIDGSYGFDSNGDNCTFVFNIPATDRRLYIKNAEFGTGVGGLPYRCTYNTGSGNTPYIGVTDINGNIKHVWRHNGNFVLDECTIEY